jgi:hypothetical protein
MSRKPTMQSAKMRRNSTGRIAEMTFIDGRARVDRSRTRQPRQARGEVEASLARRRDEERDAERREDDVRIHRRRRRARPFSASRSRRP